jgi:hypothetical protein
VYVRLEPGQAIADPAMRLSAGVVDPMFNTRAELTKQATLAVTLIVPVVNTAGSCTLTDVDAVVSVLPPPLMLDPAGAVQV